MVARDLGMSPANLNNYISEIAQKLDVFGADGIIDRAFELGILAVIDKKEDAPAVRNEIEADAEAAEEQDTIEQMDQPTESGVETSE
jgi:hypothetical protein